jgi:hypothetical protein
MWSAQSQYAYFESLERTIKVGFATYLAVFFIGTIFCIAGIKPFVDFLSEINLLLVSLLILLIGAMLVGLFYGISRVHSLGDVHVWLDEKFFGFLSRSNDIIFRELVRALDQDEQETTITIGAPAKGTVAQSILSQLSNDQNLFIALLQTGIFRLWIWYWINIYGTFVYTILTLESFTALIVRADMHSKIFFSITWLLALIHLGVSLLIGNYLVGMTQRTIDSIVVTHKEEIASLLRKNLMRYHASI